MVDFGTELSEWKQERGKESVRGPINENY